MITKITIDKDSKIAHRLHFTEMYPKILNLLAGANGSGKSTLLKEIFTTVTAKKRKELLSPAKLFSEDSFDMLQTDKIMRLTNDKSNTVVDVDKQTIVLSYFDSVDNAGERQAGYDTYLVLQKMNSGIISEGESILYSFSDLLYGLSITGSDSAFPVKNGVDYAILVDEIDSGMSTDHVDQICKAIKMLLRYRNDLQFFISFNNYHFAYFFSEIFSMYNGEFIRMFKGDYTSYISWLKENDKLLKDNRNRHDENDHIGFKEFIDPYKAVMKGIKKDKENKKEVKNDE